MKYLYIFLFACTSVVSQEIDIAKDTIKMKEVVIKEDFRKFKESKVKLKGECMDAETMNGISEIITLVENMPDGYLESVTLYLNEAHYATYRKDRKKFEDTEFEVVLYKVNPDNTPGAPVMADEKYIKVMKEHTGEVVVHFLEFNIKAPRKMFVGLRRSDGVPPGREFYIDCLCDHGKYTSLSRTSESAPWVARSTCGGLRLEANVLVYHE
jgi:hypothetical protein